MKKLISSFPSVFILFAISIFAAGSVQAAPLSKKSVLYASGDSKFEGYYVGPKNFKKNTPGILMIHNWKGITDETKKQAERYANLGYHVFAADVYGQGVRPTDPKSAGAESGKYKNDRKLFRDRLQLALNEFKKMNPSNKVVAMGYCFGGTAAIELARSGADIIGAVSFHGGLDSPTPADGKNIKAKVLALHGAIDPYVKPEELSAFENEMQNNKVDYQLVKYGGAVHSFTEVEAGNDIAKGAAYNEAADKRSFEATKNFLDEVF